MKNLAVSDLIDIYSPMLTDKQREIAENYWNFDLSLAEIAEPMGISRQAVHDTVQRTEIFLKELDEKLGLMEKFKKINFAMDTLDDATDGEAKKITDFVRKTISE